MFSFQSSSNCCWLCGSKSQLTGEHKIKKKDLTRGKKQYPLKLELKGTREEIIQGPNAKLLKFSDALCKKCNSSRSQEMDRAYDKFRDALNENAPHSDPIIKADSQTASVDTHRYFGKHLGCQLQYNKFPIPRRLVLFVQGQRNLPCFSVSMAVAPFVFAPDDGGPIQHIDGISQVAIFPSNAQYFSRLNFQSAFMNAGLHFIIRMELSILETLEFRCIFLRRSKLNEVLAASDEGKILGLPQQD